jgi:hypothetical protein
LSSLRILAECSQVRELAPVRQPGFAPGFSDWRSDVLDETGRLSLYWLYNFKLKKLMVLMMTRSYYVFFKRNHM